MINTVTISTEEYNKLIACKEAMTNDMYQMLSFVFYGGTNIHYLDTDDVVIKFVNEIEDRDWSLLVRRWY